MPTELPVFVRVSMMDVKKNKDLLGLSKTLNTELERISLEKNQRWFFGMWNLTQANTIILVASINL